MLLLVPLPVQPQSAIFPPNSAPDNLPLRFTSDLGYRFASHCLASLTLTTTIFPQCHLIHPPSASICLAPPSLNPIQSLLFDLFKPHSASIPAVVYFPPAQYKPTLPTETPISALDNTRLIAHAYLVLEHVLTSLACAHNGIPHTSSHQKSAIRHRCAEHLTSSLQILSIYLITRYQPRHQIPSHLISPLTT